MGVSEIENGPNGREDEYPLSWMHKEKLHSSDLFACVTAIPFMVLPFIGANVLLDRCFFHLPPYVLLRDRSTLVLFLLTWIAVGIPLTLVGKYLWLLVMSRFLTKADVAPIISFGIPRRITRFDRDFLNRNYRQ